MVNSYIAIDLETTGVVPEKNRILEVGAVKVVEGEIVEKYQQLVNPQIEITSQITQITGIKNEMVWDQPLWEDIQEELFEFLGDFILIGHNIRFDYSFLKTHYNRLGRGFDKRAIDTLFIARKVLCDLPSKSLGSLCEFYQINNKNAHRAYSDALATSQLYLTLQKQFENEEPGLFEAKPVFYRIKKEEPMTNRQKLYLLDLIKYHKIDNVQNIESLTKSKASKLIDQIIFQYGRLS